MIPVDRSDAFHYILSEDYGNLRRLIRESLLHEGLAPGCVPRRRAMPEPSRCTTPLSMAAIR